MKCTIEINADREEEILVFAHKRTKLVSEIEALAIEDSLDLTGYSEGCTKILELSGICCFITEGNKVFAVTDTEKWQLKSRLYQLEENLPSTFVRLNQSCIANIKKIDRFDAAFTGSLKVIFKNGYTDYVSRRQMKTVKERIGIKK